MQCHTGADGDSMHFKISSHTFSLDRRPVQSRPEEGGHFRSFGHWSLEVEVKNIKSKEIIFGQCIIRIKIKNGCLKSTS